MARRTRPPARARRPASPLVHLLVPVVAMLALGLMLGAAAWMVAVGLVASHTWDSLLSGHDPEEVVGGFTLVMALVGLHLGGLRSLKTRDRWRGLALIPLVAVDLTVGVMLLNRAGTERVPSFEFAIEDDDPIAFEAVLEAHLASLPEERQKTFDLKNRPDLLTSASRAGSARVVERIVGGSTAIRACDGAQALVQAVEGGHLDVVKVLIEGGVDVNAACGACRTEPALYMAAWLGDVPIVLTLLEGGARLECAGDDLATPLMRAASSDHADVVAVLVDRGARLDAVNGVGESALVKAADAGAMGALELLVAAGAEVDDPAVSRSALGAAAAGGHGAAVRLLLRAGADPSLPASPGDSETERAVDLAKRRGHDEVVQILEAAGQQEP